VTYDHLLRIGKGAYVQRCAEAGALVEQGHLGIFSVYVGIGCGHIVLSIPVQVSDGQAPNVVHAPVGQGQGGGAKDAVP